MGRHVLIVDDNPDSLEPLRELLRSWGHEVDVAATGSEGVTLAKERRPDVVLLDIHLPDIDGREVAHRIRAAAGEDAPAVIALTGSNEAEREAAPFDGYILKPAEPEVLRRIIERA